MSTEGEVGVRVLKEGLKVFVCQKLSEFGAVGVCVDDLYMVINVYMKPGSSEREMQAYLREEERKKFESGESPWYYVVTLMLRTSCEEETKLMGRVRDV